MNKKTSEIDQEAQDLRVCWFKWDSIKAHNWKLFWCLKLYDFNEIRHFETKKNDVEKTNQNNSKYYWVDE